MRVADGRERAGHVIIRHTTGFAQFEATGLNASGNVSGTGLVQALAIHGRVPAQTTPAPGLYSDTVVVTVTY